MRELGAMKINKEFREGKGHRNYDIVGFWVK